MRPYIKHLGEGKEIKAWLHWDWTNEEPMEDEDGQGRLFFRGAEAEEHSAIPVTLSITPEGIKLMQVDKSYRDSKKKS